MRIFGFSFDFLSEGINKFKSNFSLKLEQLISKVKNCLSQMNPFGGKQNSSSSPLTSDRVKPLSTPSLDEEKTIKLKPTDPSLYDKEQEGIPEIQDFLSYIGVDSSHYDLISQEEDEDEYKDINFSSYTINSNIAHNIKHFIQLLNPDILEEYNQVNENVDELVVQQGDLVQSDSIPLLPERDVFVHTTPDFEKIMEDGFKGVYLSTSIFNPGEEKTGLYYARGGIGLILHVPPEAIVVAHRIDVNSPIAGAPDQVKKSYALMQYQMQALHHYVARIYNHSSHIEEIRQNREKLIEQFKELGEEGGIGYMRHTSIRRLQVLIAFYKEKKLSSEESREEFEKLFGREGEDIIGELNKIYSELKKFHLVMQEAGNMKLTAGKLHKVSKITKLDEKKETHHYYGLGAGPSEHNELVAFTPQQCRELGFASPEIKGIIIFYEKEEDLQSEENQKVIALAQEQKLAVYRVPKESAFKYSPG